MFNLDPQDAIILPRPIRSPDEQQRFGEMTEARLKKLWGNKYERNMRLIQAYVDNKLNRIQREALSKRTNKEGFLIGSDIRYIVKMFELAKAEMTSVEKKKATKNGCFKGSTCDD